MEPEIRDLDKAMDQDMTAQNIKEARALKERKSQMRFMFIASLIGLFAYFSFIVIRVLEDKPLGAALGILPIIGISSAMAWNNYRKAVKDAQTAG